MSILSSIFTHRVTTVLDQIPGAPGATVTIRKLAPRHVEAASKESQRRAIADVKEIGVSLIKELRTLSEEEVKEAKTSDPLMTYDKVTLIEKGVTAWTLGEELPAVGATDARIAIIAELDEDAQDYIAREVLRLARPRLFQTKDEIEEEQKNG